MKSSLKYPYFLALDVDTREEAFKIAQEVKDFVGGFKIGPRLTYKYGETLTQELAKIAPVFVDNKYHDIPSTMIAGLKATFESGASFATIHASCGPKAMKEIAAIESEFNKKRPFKVLAVTVLTSFDENSLPSNWDSINLESHVERLAGDAFRSGITGLVCSPHEVALLRQRNANAFLVTPGIRFEKDSAKTAGVHHDQKRVMTPKEALAQGSSALVVGRAILESANRKAAAEKICAEL